MNISLFGLSISDLFGILTLEWFNLCTNPLFLNTGVPIHPMGFQYATGGWPHVTFTRITCIISVFMAIERCLCITAPLKVKSILTPRRALLVVIGIYVVGCDRILVFIKLIHNRVISGFQAHRQVKAPVAEFELAKEESRQILRRSYRALMPIKIILSVIWESLTNLTFSLLGDLKLLAGLCPRQKILAVGKQLRHPVSNW
ncbi:chemosensory receptor b [Plakobranchus ocellatus]|uniref:Chemosensory receptor b n=1 Tax=Plakobranchus ocellatus TaxID=259542 RepID=A0AAV3YIB4_9GAST|nr:chemosensory receptor b [Plakobranchus ocellatus]